MLNTCIDAYKLFRYWTFKTRLNCLLWRFSMQIIEILSFCKCLNMKANFLWGSFIQDEYEKILKCKYIIRE